MAGVVIGMKMIMSSGCNEGAPIRMEEVIIGIKGAFIDFRKAMIGRGKR